MKTKRQDTVTCLGESAGIPHGYMKLPASLNRPFNESPTKQTLLSVWDPEDIYDLVLREKYNYPEKYHTALANFLRCSKFKTVNICPEVDHGNCDFHDSHVCYCHIRFCSHSECSYQRYAKAYNRLMSWKIRTKRLYHFTFGSCFLSPHDLYKCHVKFVRRMRYRGFNLHYIKVFDIGRSSFDINGLYYYHYHYALLPEKIDIKRFIRVAAAVLNDINPVLNFHNIGWRYKEKLFSYFAKRTAGILGHKNNWYFYSDLMPLISYFQNFHNKKLLTYGLPKGLVYNISPSFTMKRCPIHDKKLIFGYYILILPEDVLDPP